MQEGSGKRTARLLKEARLWGPVAGLVLLDQLTKELAFRLVGFGGRQALIGGFLRATPRINPGLMWSMMGGVPNLVFVFLTCGVVGLLLYYHYKAKMAPDRYSLAALALVLGGAIGNVLDRCNPWRAAEAGIMGVHDFIDVIIPVINYDYPVFNFADAYIVGGVLIYLLLGFKKEKKV